MYSYSLDGIGKSKFEIANVKERKQLMGMRSIDFIDYQFKVWEKVYGEIEKGIVPMLEGEITNKPFNREGIVFEFSKLKTDKDIHKFANKYGLLGIAGPTPETEDMYTKFYKPEALPLERSNFEPIQVWWYFIEQIQKNLKLYRALVNNHRGEYVEIEDEILRLQPIEFEGQFLGHYWVTWSDGSETNVQLTEKEAEKMDFISIGRQVLIQNIKPMIEKGKKFIDPKIVESNKPPLGITVIESEYTPYLLTAIYDDFWKLISKNHTVSICENPKCKLPFNKVKRQKYCSNACKQEHYRIRKNEKAQLL